MVRGDSRRRCRDDKQSAGQGMRGLPKPKDGQVRQGRSSLAGCCRPPCAWSPSRSGCSSRRGFGGSQCPAALPFDWVSETDDRGLAIRGFDRETERRLCVFVGAAIGPGTDRAGEAPLVHGDAGVDLDVIDGRAVGGQGPGQGRATVILQRPQFGVGVDQVGGRGEGACVGVLEIVGGAGRRGREEATICVCGGSNLLIPLEGRTQQGEGTGIICTQTTNILPTAVIVCYRAEGDRRRPVHGQSAPAADNAVAIGMDGCVDKVQHAKGANSATHSGPIFSEKAAFDCGSAKACVKQAASPIGLVTGNGGVGDHKVTSIPNAATNTAVLFSGS